MSCSLFPCGSRDPDTHDRIGHLQIASRHHHIGIGPTYTGTCVIVLIPDLHIRVINSITGELVRELLLDPNCGYQPAGAPKELTRRRHQPKPK